MGTSFQADSMFAPQLFTGTTAVVTGGGRGIGAAIALGFARLGANVVIASNEPDELAEIDQYATESEINLWRDSSA